ncbi:MAG TPA: class I SAM-dependent methyltransferase [Bryobacteraceae bacterium]|nr:class I SAM-dependent methyltransferase [Bryobacteraceae bacterium]
MGPEGAAQLSALSELFRCAVATCLPQSVAVLGVAGGNGLENIEHTGVKRVVGIDINPRYLQRVEQRFGGMAGLELHCADISRCAPGLEAVDLVHAALIFEHTGMEPALGNALSLVAPGGSFSVVLQLPASGESAVAKTSFASMQRLAPHFVFIDTGRFRGVMEDSGFVLAAEQTRTVNGGKSLWLGIFGRGK